MPVDLQAFIKNVLRPAYKKYSEFLQSIVNGTALFETCETYMQIESNLKTSRNSQAKDWQANFIVMMTSGNTEDALIKQRLKQLELYLKLTHISGIVRALLDVKGKNKLVQNFPFLEALGNSVSFWCGYF